MDFCSLVFYFVITVIIIQIIRFAIADADLNLLTWTLFDKTGVYCPAFSIICFKPLAKVIILLYLNFY